jgi:hypothetical protein
MVLFRVFVSVDDDAHPGMNAALVEFTLVLLDFRARDGGACGHEDVLIAGRLRHEHSANHAGALRRGHGIAAGSIEGREESAAEMFDFGEGVSLAFTIYER